MASVKFTEKVKLLFKNNMDDYIKAFRTGADLDDPAFGDSMDSTTAMK